MTLIGRATPPPAVRRLLLCAALLALPGRAAAAQVKPDVLNEDGLAGAVSYVREEDVETGWRSGRLVEKARRVDSIDTYSREGRKLSYTAFKDDGGLLYSMEFRHDARGRILERRVRRAEHVYMSELQKYIYDERGRLVEIKGFDPPGRHVGGFLFEYDEAGREIERKSYSVGRNPFFNSDHLTRYTYGEGGRLLTQSSYVYDERGARPDEHGMGYHRKEFEEDDRGRRVKTVFRRLGGSVAYVETESYDSRGNTAEEARYSADGRVLRRATYTYRFDRQGNWVRQERRQWVAETENSLYDDVEISYRTIRYYPRAGRAPRGGGAVAAPRGRH